MSFNSQPEWVQVNNLDEGIILYRNQFRLYDILVVKDMNVYYEDKNVYYEETRHTVK